MDISDNAMDSGSILCEAIYNGDVETIQHFAANNASVIVEEHIYGLTPLHHAIICGNETMIEIMISCGASIKECCSVNDLPLNIRSYLPSVSDLPISDLLSCFSLAVCMGDEDIVTALLKKQKRKTLKQVDGKGLGLCLASYLNHCSVVRELVRIGSTKYVRNAKLADKSTPLLLAAVQGNGKIFKFLIDHTRNPYKPNLQGKTILHCLAQQGNTKLLKWLLDKTKYQHHPQHCCVIDKSVQRTPSELALAYGNFNTFKVLLSSVCKFKCPANSYLLHLAAKLNCIDFARYLLDKGFEVNKPDIFYSTPLCEAVIAQNHCMVQFLLSKGADPNLPQSPKEPPLMVAVRFGSRKIVRSLLKAGADVNIQDITGLNPLCLAASVNSPDMVKLLIDNGANINQFTMQGWSALLFAARYGNLEVVQTLLKHRASLRPNPSCRASVLHNAISSGKLPIVELLVQQGADIDFLNISGWSPLMSACMLRRSRIMNMARFLIRCGAEVNTDTDITALHMAIGKNMRELVQLLLSAGADVHRHPLCCLHNALELAVFIGAHLDICYMLHHAGASLRSSFVDEFQAYLSGKKSKWVCICGAIPRLSYYLPLWMESCHKNEERERAKFSVFTTQVLDYLKGVQSLKSLSSQIIRKRVHYQSDAIEALPVPSKIRRLIDYADMCT